MLKHKKSCAMLVQLFFLSLLHYKSGVFVYQQNDVII